MRESEATPPEPRDKAVAEPSLLVSNRRVGPGWYLLRLRHPAIARASRPGNFVQILCTEAEATDPLLRRPFSVYSADRAAGTYDILHTPVGRGTRWMADLPEEAPRAEDLPIDVEGPFGNTFTAPGPADRVYLVGGGVGVAPLYFLALDTLAAARESGTPPPRMTLCMGARRKELLQGIDEFRKLPIDCRVATEDGSEGFRGLVTALAGELLDELRGKGPRERERGAGEADLSRVRVYGCGPQGMNESLRALLVERGVWGEICLESLMACGFGICFGCVAPIRKEVGGPFYNRRICWEGPVFDARLLHPGIDG